MAHLPFLLLLALIFSSVGPTTLAGPTGSELIQSTCKNTLHTDLCVSSLSSDPASQTADLAGLAAIALKQARASASSIEQHITELLKENNEDFIEQCLNDCMENYLDATDQIEDSISAIDSKGYNDINTWVTAAMADSESCEDGFKEQPGHQSPLSTQNEEFSKLCSNAMAITNLLSG